MLGTITDVVRSVVGPAALTADQAETAIVEAPNPAGLYEVDEILPVEQIEAAAREYERAADQARLPDHGERAAKKVLERLPASAHGTWRVFRTPSSRQAPDLAEITRIFKAHGLGPVSMKACAPSLKVKLAETAPVDVDTPVLVGT
ncbi:hypothetical protein SLINC_4706 [Streptomyces lincolnensis]|uniref:Uncharacterized protein n=1 Tax=Streptomyces lincolnensis TaxID=1915 RepID=A0A1B1ME73_STRLN|nr:hypothetical protein [Streptomyces lincolnensis]ANS66930.1 hypothetical protein SLINC_4706 [Streptomyces lincolnensis]AXG55802.1 hypothetical protein SLCG_4647 [Streptomyces lincolnensis]QMV12408.1 hypothetical protein GJU35_19875 [Streptomyces lincolnensis]